MFTLLYPLCASPVTLYELFSVYLKALTFHDNYISMNWVPKSEEFLDADAMFDVKMKYLALTQNYSEQS